MPEVITKVWSEAEIQSLIERAELLVGRPLAGLIAKHAAAIAVGTAPKHRHRLIELILRLKAAAANPDGLIAGAAAVSAAEINAVLDLYEDWTNSQAFADFQRALRSPHDYLHAVATLSVASMLRVHHPDVELVAATSTARTPDLRLAIPDEAGLAVEVKAPPALWQRDAPLDIEEAVWMVRNSLGSAGTTIGGQLAPPNPGVLVVAGLLLSEATFDTLMAGTDVALQNQEPRRPHLLGIALFNWRMRIKVDSAVGLVHMLLEEESRLGRSPHYRGRLQLVGDWGSTWHLETR